MSRAEFRNCVSVSQQKPLSARQHASALLTYHALDVGRSQRCAPSIAAGPESASSLSRRCSCAGWGCPRADDEPKVSSTPLKFLATTP
jgi:hypothetical protein